jgi:hypothetical protein
VASQQPNHTAPDPAPAPGAGPNSGGYESNPLRLVKPTWEGFKLNFRSYLGLVVIAWGIAILSFGVIAILVFALHLAVLGFLLGAAGVLAVIYFGITVFLPAVLRLQIAMARHQKLTLRDAVAGNSRVGWRLLGAGVLTGLAVLGGFILLIVPGIIFGVWFSLAAYAVVAEDLGVIAAMKRSRQLVKNRFWDTFGAGCLYQCFTIFYFIPFLGNLIVIALSIVFAPLMALRYLQLAELKQHSDGKDVPTSPVNYIVIVVGFILTSAYSFHNSQQRADLLRQNQQVEKTSGPY